MGHEFRRSVTRSRPRDWQRCSTGIHDEEEGVTVRRFCHVFLLRSQRRRRRRNRRGRASSSSGGGICSEFCTGGEGIIILGSFKARSDSLRGGTQSRACEVYLEFSAREAIANEEEKVVVFFLSFSPRIGPSRVSVYLNSSSERCKRSRPSISPSA